MDDWETLADEDVPVTLPAAKSINVNKWQGEDEEEDVKDSWEDDEEEAEQEKKDDEKPAVKPKPKMSLKQKIAEKEAAREAELAAKELERVEQMSDEDKLAEKLRLQKIQEEADLQLALETFGVTEKDLVAGAGAGVIDGAQPKDKEELGKFKDDLVKKIVQFKAVDGFAGFIEELVQGISVTLVASDLQKIKRTVDNLYTEKQKMEKEKSKKGGKGKAKATLKMDNTSASVKAYDTYDYDDFM